MPGGNERRFSIRRDNSSKTEQSPLPTTAQPFPNDWDDKDKKKCGTQIIFLSLSNASTFTINHLNLRAPRLLFFHKCWGVK